MIAAGRDKLFARVIILVEPTGKSAERDKSNRQNLAGVIMSGNTRGHDKGMGGNVVRRVYNILYFRVRT